MSYRFCADEQFGDLSSEVEASQPRSSSPAAIESAAAPASSGDTSSPLASPSQVNHVDDSPRSSWSDSSDSSDSSPLSGAASSGSQSSGGGLFSMIGNGVSSLASAVGGLLGRGSSNPSGPAQDDGPAPSAPVQVQPPAQPQVVVRQSPIGGQNASGLMRSAHGLGISHTYLQTTAPDGALLASGMGAASESGSTGRGDAGLASPVAVVDHGARARADAADPTVRSVAPEAFVGLSDGSVDHGRLAQVMGQENQQRTDEGRYALPNICWTTTERQTLRALTDEGVREVKENDQRERMINLGDPIQAEPIGNSRQMHLLGRAQAQNEATPLPALDSAPAQSSQSSQSS